LGIIGANYGKGNTEGYEKVGFHFVLIVELRGRRVGTQAPFKSPREGLNPQFQS